MAGCGCGSTPSAVPPGLSATLASSSGTPQLGYSPMLESELTVIKAPAKRGAWVWLLLAVLLLMVLRDRHRK